MVAKRNAQSTDFNLRRLKSNLTRSASAMRLLAEMGVDAAAVDAVGLGMKEPYVRANGTEVSGVLAYPLDVPGHRRRYGYVNLSGLTENGDHPVAWGPGAAATVRAGRGSTAVVGSSPVEVWQLGGAAARLGLEVVAIASSQPDVLPDEWQSAAFWARWDRLIVSEGVAPAVVARIVEVARRPVERAPGVVCPGAVDASEVHGRQDEWLEDLLEFAAVPSRVGSAFLSDGRDAPGDFAARPISVHGGFARGFLFYPFLVERRRVAGDERGGLLHSY